jgi:hypothetical protein
MDRLTHTWKKGKDTFCAIADCEDKCQNQGVPSCHCSPMMQVRNRLAAYEDTGLTPEEITNLHYDHQEFRRYVAENARLRAERDKAVEDINLVFGRVRALADCDGYHPYENVCDLCAFFDGGEKRECHGNCKNARWRRTEGKA